MATNKKQTLINEQIRANEVRLIGHDGEPLGIVSGKEALKLSEEKNMDLVMIAENAKPPVCKIMDYGKYVYEQQKKTKEAKKKQKTVSIKEIRMSLSIEEHDINIKAKRAKKFLESGDKVKVTVRFRGREAEHSHIGNKILDNFYSKVEDISVIEKPAKKEGRNMLMILAPRKA
ncbi:translation initiation factor IF-3 [Oceanirhabdus sp. W0125-5]|nr:translation initiation factor IF-3 [Oceanirhabdus sp. W0125-5]WBW99742.1 translation initiation factor IF-3 [Oceanirhabdus sp. W0125-5]